MDTCIFPSPSVSTVSLNLGSLKWTSREKNSAVYWEPPWFRTCRVAHGIMSCDGNSLLCSFASLPRGSGHPWISRFYLFLQTDLLLYACLHNLSFFSNTSCPSRSSCSIVRSAFIYLCVRGRFFCSLELCAIVEIEIELFSACSELVEYFSPAYIQNCVLCSKKWFYYAIKTRNTKWKVPLYHLNISVVLPSKRTPAMLVLATLKHFLGDKWIRKNCGRTTWGKTCMFV